MGLNSLDTKVSVQGYISGAMDVTSPDVTLKFARGGFAPGTNGISNGALIAPSQKVPGTKTASIFYHPISVNYHGVNTDQTKKSQAFVNDKYLIHDGAPEVLAVFSFTKDDIESLLAAVYQAYVEDRCSMEFSKFMIRLVNQSDEKFLPFIKQGVAQNITDAENQLRAVETLVKICLDVNSSMNNLQTDALSNFAEKKYQSLNPDKVGLQGNGWFDPLGLLSKLGGDKKEISIKSNTAVLVQLLSVVSKILVNGASSIPLGKDSLFKGKLVSTRFVNDRHFVEQGLSNDDLVNMSRLSLSNERSRSFIYGIDEKGSYIEKLNIDLMKGVLPLQKAAYLVSILSNEFAVSAGLSRLDGTKLGQSFNTGAGWRNSFLGTEGMTDASTEASQVDSLVDYFVVNSEGKNRLTSENGVLLFDGNRIPSTEKRKNVFDAFVAGTTRFPVSKAENGSQRLANGLQAANNRFDLGLEFFRKLTCRDKQQKLTTPRGLFSRLLSDISDAMFDFKSSQRANSQQARELAFLSVIGNTSKTDTGKNSPTSVVKRILLRVMAQKAYQIQSSLDTASATTTDRQSQAKMPTNGKAINTNKLRFCMEDNKLTEDGSWSGAFNDLLLAMSDLPVSSGYARSSVVHTIKFAEAQFLSAMLSQQDGMIDKLVKIYIDLFDEATQFCLNDNVFSSIVTPDRLTKNSQIDGTLSLSLILESAIFLAAEFVDARISDKSPLQIKKKSFGANKNVISKEAIAQQIVFSPMEIEVKIGENSSTYFAAKSLKAVTKASDNNDFSSLFLPENRGFVIPEIGAMKQTTPISYDGQSQLTVKQIVDTFQDLITERELPAICMSIVAATAQHFSQVTAKYVSIGSQLLGESSRTNTSDAIVNFANTTLGSKFFSSLNNFSIDIANLRLRQLQREVISECGRNPKITLGEFRCLELFLKNGYAWSPNNQFLVVALPKDFVMKSLNENYSSTIDKNSNLGDEAMFLTVERTPVFGTKTDNFSTKFMIRSPIIDSESFDFFNSVIPKSIQDVVNNVSVDGVPGSKFIAGKSQKEEATETLFNEVASYLFKKMFSVISSIDLFASNIEDTESFSIDKNSATIAKKFAEAYGLSPSVFNTCFLFQEDGTAKISAENIVALTIEDFDLSDQNINVKLPPLKFGEAELFYDLFESIYFQTGTIQKRVFATTILDETVGIVVNDVNFPRKIDGEQLVTNNGIIIAGNVSQNLEKESQKNSTPAFDTYSVSLSSTEPLVNA